MLYYNKIKLIFLDKNIYTIIQIHALQVETNKKITLSTILSTNFAEINKKKLLAQQFFFINFRKILTESKLIKS
jgi:hypothetical protein